MFLNHEEDSWGEEVSHWELGPMTEQMSLDRPPQQGGVDSAATAPAIQQFGSLGEKVPEQALLMSPQQWLHP